MRNFRIFVFLMTGLGSCSQNPTIIDLRSNANYNAISLHENARLVQDYSSDSLNYVRTLLYNWKLMKTDSTAYPSDLLLQSLSFVGDIQSISRFSRTKLPPYPQLADTSYLNKLKRRPFKYHPAKRFIIESYKNSEIIMFNEGHDRPQTRAFVVSILEDLKKVGATCLAMETLTEHGNLHGLDGSTGYFTLEPVSGELVREALRLGFELIPYEDRSLGHSTTNQRDSIQAANLFNRIKTKDGIQKTVVLAGYGHISEKPIGEYISMAINFKQISGIDPLTVEQTLLLEEFEASPYANRAVNKVLGTDSVLAFTCPEVKRFGFDTAAYDISIYHPPTAYLHNRPTWVLSTSDKVFTSIEIPKEILPVLVQAFYKSEISSDRDYYTRIPADQTFYSEDNCVWLALRKNTEYKIVYRDDKNKVLKVRDIKP